MRMGMGGEWERGESAGMCIMPAGPHDSHTFDSPRQPQFHCNDKKGSLYDIINPTPRTLASHHSPHRRLAIIVTIATITLNAMFSYSLHRHRRSRLGSYSLTLRTRVVYTTSSSHCPPLHLTAIRVQP